MRKYKLVNGVRIQTKIPEEIATRYRDREMSYFGGFESDDLCFLEHYSIGGSSPMTNYPLTPYSLLSGIKTEEDLFKNRIRQAHIRGIFVFDLSKNSAVLGKNRGGNLLLKISPAVEKLFLELLKNESVLNGDFLSLFLEFERPKFNPKTKRIILPNASWTFNDRIEKKLASGIKLEEMLIFAHNNVRTIIDHRGWRVEFED